MTPKRATPPPEDPISDGLAHVRDLLGDAIDHPHDATDYRLRVGIAVSALLDEVEEQRAAQRQAEQAKETRPITAQRVMARSMKQLRNECQWTQETLAAHMRRIGFVTWRRITVAESESGKRGLAPEELYGLAALFDCPVWSMATALEPGEVLVLNERRTMTPRQVQELAYGPSDLFNTNRDTFATARRREATVSALEICETTSGQDWRYGGEQ